MTFTIIATGSATPAFVLDNGQLSHMVDTSDEWITSRTGMHERHICTTESMTALATQAAEKALAQARLSAADLDLILCATLQGDYICPSLSCTVQQALGAVCPAMDINAACTGFLYALDVADGYFARGKVRHVLVIGAECMSRFVDWEDRATCVLFGDGAGAVVLGPGDGLRALHLEAQGSPQHLNIPGTVSTFPLASYEPHKQAVYMNGQEIYRFAVQAMCRDIQEAIAEAGITLEDVRYVLAHQANSRILEAAQARLGIPAEKMPMILDRYGNMSAASVPILLDEVHREGKLQEGDFIVLCAFGGGLTAGAAVIQWQSLRA